MQWGFGEVLFGVVLVFWALIGRRIYRYPEPNEVTGEEELKGWTIRHVWPFALVIGALLIVIGLARLIA
jgi:hypothetical protein